MLKLCSRQDIKKGATNKSNALFYAWIKHYFLCLGSQDTVNL